MSNFAAVRTHNVNVAQLKTWKKAWSDYSQMCHIPEMDLEKQQAIFRSALSLQMRDILEERIGMDDDEGPDDLLEKIEKHIRNKRSVVLDMVAFDQREQKEGEDLDSYLVAIQQLAQDADLVAKHCPECSRNCLDRRLATRLISGIRDEGAREKLFRESEIPTKDYVVKVCSSRENATKGLSEHKNDLVVQAAYNRQGPQGISGSGQKYKVGPFCKNCGGKFHKNGQDCYAKQLLCNFCKKVGHIERMCLKKKQMRFVSSEEQMENDDNIKFGRITISSINDTIAVPILAKLQKTGESLGQVYAIADSGAQLCVAGPHAFHVKNFKALLPPRNKKMFGFDGTQANCVGRLLVTLENDFYSTDTEIHICTGVKDILLSLSVSKALGYIRHEYPKVISPHIQRIAHQEWKISESASNAEMQVIKQRLLQEYKDVFACDDSLNIMEGKPMHIEVSTDAVPYKITAARNLPFAARSSIKTQLDDMVAKKIIAVVDYPTPWVHPLVPVMKPDGTWRLCVDLSRMNKYIQRPYYPMVTPKDAVQLPITALIFATLDAKAGYWQIELDKASQDLTTFISPYGRYKFLRAPMGLASTQDEYCRRTDEIFTGLEQFRKVVDDLLIYGSSKQDLLNHVLQVLDRCRKNRITLNPKKFQFGLDTIDYVGYKVSKDGVQVNDKKIEGITKFPQPTNTKELQSFMGLVNQFSHFTTKISQAATPLRDLMKPKNKFIWNEEHTSAFKELKNILGAPPVLAQYDPSLPTMLQTDASKLKGLGYALLQKHGNLWKLVQCGSRFLSDTETRYAMIEIELLAVVWAVVKKCSTYLRGLRFQLIIDHKPLLPILNSYTLDMIQNPRLQTLRGKLQRYTFDTIWRKGSEHYIPDALSRAPISNPSAEDLFTEEIEGMVESKINYITAEELHPQNFNDPLLSKLEEAASQDKGYLELVKAIEQGFNEKEITPAVRPFWQVRNELSVAGHLVLKGTQIVIPVKMRKDILANLHSSHQGIERTKRRARQAVYWPGINSDIKNTVEACEPCQTYRPSQCKEPIVSDPIPSQPFVDTSADLFSYGTNHYLVYVDRYSGWPIVEAWNHDPTSQQVVQKLIPSFATYGIPVRLKTDGGPQFASKFFKDFALEWSIQLVNSSPHYPQSNGHAEAAVKAMKMLIIKTNCKDKLHNAQFQEGLLEWRNTPKEFGCSPAQLLFGRSIRTKVPLCNGAMKMGPDEINHSRRKEIKDKAQQRYDRNAHELPILPLGQEVRVQDTISKRWNKNGHIIKISENNRSYLIKMEHGREWWRNRRFIRPYNSSANKNAVVPLTPPQRTTSSDNQLILPRRSSRERKPPDRYQSH